MWSRSTVWVDANGRKTIFRVNSGTGMGGAAAALAALSNAAELEHWESNVSTSVPAPVAAAYQSGQDRAALVFVCADGTTTAIIVPAPALAIFMADGETVDITNVDVVAFVAAAVAAPLTNGSGSAVTGLVSGQRLPRASNPA